MLSSCFFNSSWDEGHVCLFPYAHIYNQNYYGHMSSFHILILKELKIGRILGLSGCTLYYTRCNLHT